MQKKTNECNINRRARDLKLKELSPCHSRVSCVMCCFFNFTQGWSIIPLTSPSVIEDEGGREKLLTNCARPLMMCWWGSQQLRISDFHKLIEFPPPPLTLLAAACVNFLVACWWRQKTFPVFPWSERWLRKLTHSPSSARRASSLPTDCVTPG